VIYWGARLEQALDLHGLRQVAVCRATGLADATVSHWLSGLRIPTLYAALTCAEYLGWSLDDLIDEQPLAAPTWLPAEVRPRVSSEWSAAMLELVELHTMPGLARALSLDKSGIRRWVLGAEPRLGGRGGAARVAQTLGLTLHGLALGRLQGSP